jgi:hypothetical protein
VIGAVRLFSLNFDQSQPIPGMQSIFISSSRLSAGVSKPKVFRERASRLFDRIGLFVS